MERNFSEVRDWVSESVSVFKNRLAHLPQLVDAMAVVNERPFVVVRTVKTYLGLVETFGTPLKAIMMDIVNTKLNGQKQKAGSSTVTMDTFAQEFIGCNLQEILVSATSLNSPDQINALNELTAMMTNGHNIAQKDPTAKPEDGDKEWDNVIWGHTQIVPDNPQAFIDFTVCHFMERAVSEYFAERGIEKPKDFFLTWMTNALLLDVALFGENSRYYKTYELWKLPKNQGGLGWINESREKEFIKITSPFRT